MTFPDPVTWGHLLMLAGLLALAYGAWQLIAFLRHRGRGNGRHALGSGAAGAVLYAAGCFSPLCQVPVA